MTKPIPERRVPRVSPPEPTTEQVQQYQKEQQKGKSK
jgi:hypothetical protein